MPPPPRTARHLCRLRPSALLPTHVAASAELLALVGGQPQTVRVDTEEHEALLRRVAELEQENEALNRGACRL